MEKRISTLMTVFNAENFISQSIKSILRQTHKNFEFIIIDDFSDDSSAKIISEFKDDRIRFFKLEKKLGRTKALNYGLKKCTSDFIAVQDADDVSEFNRFSESLSVLNNNQDVGLVFSDYKLINETNSPLDKKFIISKEKNIFSKIKYFNFVAHSSILFKKESLKDFKLYDEDFKYAQDYNLILRFLRDSKIHFINKHLISLRHHKNNMSNTKIYKKTRIMENIKLLEFSRKNFKNNFKEISFIIFYKIKNYCKLILYYLGV